MRTVWFYGLSLAVVAVDQITKALARMTLDSPVTLVPGFLQLRLGYNDGGAFGVLPDWTPLFIIVALVVIFAIVKLGRARQSTRSMSAGLGLLLGGAAGNMIDRVVTPKRGVTDFIDISIGKYNWPTFNVADIAIVAGALLVLYNVYIVERIRAESEY